LRKKVQQTHRLWPCPRVCRKETVKSSFPSNSVEQSIASLRWICKWKTGPLKTQRNPSRFALCRNVWNDSVYETPANRGLKLCTYYACTVYGTLYVVWNVKYMVILDELIEIILNYISRAYYSVRNLSVCYVHSDF